MHASYISPFSDQRQGRLLKQGHLFRLIWYFILIIGVTPLWLSCIDINRQKKKYRDTVKILKFGTPQTIAIILLKIEKFDVTLH